MSIANERASKTRFVVLAILCALTFILYLDRICMAQAVKPIKDEMGLSDTSIAYILMAFTLAYGLFELPVGHMGDRQGARRTLTRIVVWWSGFTALTGACTGFWSLLLVRFLFGAGEAGAYPNVVRVVHNWFAPSERGRVQGLIMAFAMVGGAFSPALAAYLIELCGWRWTFVIFGSVGVFWAAGFFYWFRDLPHKHSGVNADELAIISPSSKHNQKKDMAEFEPWSQVLSQSNLWLLGAIMAFASFNSYLYFSWYSKYLQTDRLVSNIEAGWLASLVLGGGAIGSLLGGAISDIVSRGWPNRISVFRRFYCPCVFFLAAVFLLISVACPSARLSAIFAAISCLAIHSQLSFWWSAAAETGGQRMGAVFGLANGLGTFGAMSSQYFFGVFADWRRSQGYEGRDVSDPAFLVYASVLAAGGICWFFIKPKPIEIGDPLD